MLALLLAATVTCTPPTTKDLVGFWETRKTSMGGIGGALDLRADGSASSLITVLVGFTYELEGDRLRLRWENDPPEKVPNAIPVRFEENAFIQIATDGTEMRRTRVGSPTPGASPIVGVWSYAHYTGSQAFERYGADGTMRLRLPMRGTRGCYSINKDRLVLELERQKEKRHRFVVEGDELRLTTAGEKEPERLVRVQVGAWYVNDKSIPGLE
jgi:hypothetical protein